MKKQIENIFDLLIDLSWYFGNQSFDGECCRDLSLVEYMTLKKIISTPNLTVQEIGNQLNITKSGISKVITRLEKKDYIEREKLQSDGRVCCISCTNKAVNILDDISKSYQAYLSNALVEVNKEFIGNIEKSLEILETSISRIGYKNKED